MKQRLLVAAVGVPLLIVVLVLLPPYATAILTAAIAGAAAWAFGSQMCSGKRPAFAPNPINRQIAAAKSFPSDDAAETAAESSRITSVPVTFCKSQIPISAVRPPITAIAR